MAKKTSRSRNVSRLAHTSPGLIPEKTLQKQQYLAAESDENGRVVYMVLYHSVHGERYRDWNGRDLWKEALTLLGRSIRREHGLIWLGGTKVVSALPWPYNPEPKLAVGAIHGDLYAVACGLVDNRIVLRCPRGLSLIWPRLASRSLCWRPRRCTQRHRQSTAPESV
jgi:hypothetical protein